MIFLTAFSHDVIVPGYESKRFAGQFLYEYKFLLKSLKIIYPDAIPILYLFQGEINIADLQQLHPNFIFDHKNDFDQRLGIDLNNLRVLMDCRSKWSGHDICMIDCDCIIVKRFDDLLDDKIDITSVTRGFIKWNGRRHDLVFNPGIYHKNNPDAVNAYIRRAYQLGSEIGINSGDFWSNVQAAINEIHLDAGMDLKVNYDGFTAEFGEIKLDDQSIRLRVLPQYVLGYPIQDDKFYDDTRIIHYKTHKRSKQRDHAERIFNQWMPKTKN